MDWRLQLCISILVPIISSVFSYFAAVKKANVQIEGIKITADNEINKIKEESEKELKRIQKETDEQIRLKITEKELSSKSNEEQLTNDIMEKFLNEFIKDPKSSANKLKEMQKIAHNLKK